MYNVDNMYIHLMKQIIYAILRDLFYVVERLHNRFEVH